jgi:photosystem II stability/assembly factor-like uncharacterized protein
MKPELRRAGFWSLICVLALVAFAPDPSSTAQASAATGRAVTAQDFESLKWRVIGPAVMGGRLDAVASVPGDAETIYLGHSSGGLYASRDGGLRFASIFHEGRSSSIGAVAIAPSDPDVLYIGTGEGFPRNTAALGDGVFVSKDAGEHWRYSGLAGSEHIAKIAIDPTDARVALVAAMGPEFTPGGERGIYRTQDGGATWQRVLFVNPTTGGSDVAFDPANPSIAFAGTFDYLRQPWHFRGGGTGSGLYRSTDGGRTWTALTDAARHDGLPGGVENRVGLSISAHHPNVIFAIIPTSHGMLYRSDDTGMTWQLVNADQDLVFRPFYFSQVRVDPDDARRVWIVSGGLRLSTNGGKTFHPVDAGGDNHDLWIDPSNPKRVLLGSDVGFDISYDGGRTWAFVNSVPFAQIYRVGVDRAIPYHVMGGLQDHEVWWGPSTLWNDTGVAGGSWRNISDWGDGQYAKPDPANPDVIYEDTHFGDLAIRNLATGEARYISPQPAITFGTGAGSYPYRFNWSSPFLVSPHDPHVLYYGANVLFRTNDRGQTWQAISPDLSQPCDPSWLGVSGGPITHDNTNAEAYCTIYALAEDAGSAQTLWAGTDDGNLYLTRDSGATWTNMIARIKGLPPRSWVASIDASPTRPGVAHVTFDRHRFGDTNPYVYVTHDYGQTWTKISNGLALWAYVVREDPHQASLLFAGTEDGIYASFDGGARWLDLRLGVDHVPVYDLQFQPDSNDLIIGTHGRGFAILDDITALEGLASAVQTTASLFAPVDAWRYVSRPYYDTRPDEFVAPNKPYGAIISFYLAPSPPARTKKAKEHVQLEVLNASGSVIRHLSAAGTAGINRLVWDLTTDAPGWPHTVQDSRQFYVFYPLAISGPEVLPGSYTIRLRARGMSITQPLTVRLDPAVQASQSDLQAQYDTLERLASMQERAETWVAAVAADTKKLGKRDPSLVAALNAFADRLRNGNGSQNAGYQHPAQLIDEIAYTRNILATSLSGPTRAQQAMIDRYEQELDGLVPTAQKLLAQARKEAQK